MTVQELNQDQLDELKWNYFYSDYYDEKIDANSVLNKAELRHFHQDLQQYLTDNGIEGKVITGKTGGVNFTVQELKEFTANTGLRLEDIQELTADKGILEALVSSNDKVQTLEQIIKEKNLTIANLQTEIQSRDRAIDRMDSSEEITVKDTQIKELETEKAVDVKPAEQAQSWGQESSSAWGANAHSGWGTNTVDNERENLW